MKRLKCYWNKLHPEFTFSSDKNLRDVAFRIAVNKVVIDAESDNTSSIYIHLVNNEIVDEVNRPVNTVSG